MLRQRGRMNKPFRLLGFCGLYCGACNHYRASFPDRAHLHQGDDPGTFTCRGCRGETEFLHQGCDVCRIRLCAEGRGFLHCGECDAFPCEKIVEFQHDVRHIHHFDVVDNLCEMKENGPEAWLGAQKVRWTCDCGMPYSWYEARCSRCGTGLISYAQRPE
jgi:hypothetical protein